MSPVTHTLIGWVISQPMKSKKDRLLVTIAATFSDIDAVSLFAGFGNYQKYHHTLGHNIFIALLYSSLCTLMTKETSKIFLLTLIAFHSHIICDLLGSGADWGIFYFWPISRTELISAPPFQWELDSWQNLMITFSLIVAVFMIGVKKGRTVLELFSARLDMIVVSVFKNWFSKF